MNKYRYEYKYKLINKQTGEEYLCNKIVLDDGYDYYIEIFNYEKYPDMFTYYIDISNNELIHEGDSDEFINPYWRKVIATTNTNIDVPKVIDEVEMWINETTSILKDEHTIRTSKMCLKAGYNKSQETYQFNDKDMIDFTEWKIQNLFFIIKGLSAGIIQWKSNNKLYSETYTTEELLKIWKEQQIETLYYE